jgi:hypothetical protein
MSPLSLPEEASLRLLTPPGITLRIIVVGRATMATSVTALSEYVLEAHPVLLVNPRLASNSLSQQPLRGALHSLVR